MGRLQTGKAEWPQRQALLCRRLQDGGLSKVPVKVNADRAVLLGQVARIAEGPAPKRGDASVDGHAGVVVTIVKQPHADTRKLTAEVKTALREAEAAHRRERGGAGAEDDADGAAQHLGRGGAALMPAADSAFVHAMHLTTVVSLVIAATGAALIAIWMPGLRAAARRADGPRADHAADPPAGHAAVAVAMED